MTLQIIETTALDNLSYTIIGAAMEVHRNLGPGLLESVYEECLAREFKAVGLKFARQIELPIKYKGSDLEYKYRLDFLVEDLIIVELKAVEKILAVHEAQLLTYLKISLKKLGLIINFNVPVLKDGIRRLLN